ncbi:MAG: tRNA lysidine(34) synthetase TilS [Phycisphaerales bacterium]
MDEHTGRDLSALRRLPFSRSVIGAWRRLTADAAPESRRTLVACSGGADSTGLALALHAARCPMVIAHVVHTMRPRAASLSDRDAVRKLATRLDVPFVEADLADEPAESVGTRNAEGAARRRRYAALLRMARQHDCGFVATGHHGGDQLESVLMALIRGSGTGGLRGLASSRRLAPGERPGHDVTLIRPMLGVTHEQACAVCRFAEVGWCEDATNADESRMRSALRRRVIPILEELRPGASGRSTGAAATVASAHELLQREARRVLRRSAVPSPRRDGSAGFSWERAALREASAVVLAQALRLAFARLTRREALDALPARSLDAAARAIRSRSGEPKRFEWPAGVRLSVERETVVMVRIA